MTDEKGLFTPAERSTAWWRRRSTLRKTGLLTAVTVLATSVVWGSVELYGSCWSPGAGVTRIDGECVGVTDGSYIFRDELADVQRKIADENANVLDNPSGYVTLALLDPLTPASANVFPDGAIRHRLEGAYTALRRVNSTRGVAGDFQPKIRLLLASEGATDAQREHVTGQLVEMSEQEENPLAAVIGLGVSTEHTRSRAEDLSDADIPMVGASLTADMLSFRNIPGLIKTAPTNRHYVEALSDYVKEKGLKSAIMVRDNNSNSDESSSSSRIDLFTATLAENFEHKMAELINFGDVYFTGTVDAEGAAPPDPLFDPVTTNICASAYNGLDSVLYAGREIDFDDFLDSLEGRSCKQTPLSILTGGLDLGDILKGRNLEEANLKVAVAGTVNTEGWIHKTEETPEYFGDFLKAFNKEGFVNEDLGDANAIMMHDALLTATRAVRLVAENVPAESVTPETVKGQLLNLHDAYAVRGASGTLNFRSDSLDPGNPVGKVVPVLEYSDGSFRQFWPLYTVKN